MSGSSLKIAALVAVLLAVLLGGLAWRATIKATEEAKREAVEQAMARVPEPESRVLAVIAMQPLSANEPVRPDQVAVKAVPVAPSSYYTTVDDVVGRVPLLDVDAGAPVTPRYFKDSNVLARLIPENHRAVSLEVSDVVAVGGFVRPADRVDLLLYVRDQNQQQQSRVLLRDVLVLAYEERIIERPQGVEDDSRRTAQRGRIRTAVVAVPEKEVTRVMLAASVGDIRLALQRQEPDLARTESTLPEPSPTPSGEDPSIPVTLEELSRIIRPTPTPAPRPVRQTYSVDVFRGGAVSKERAQ
ncbi:MAG: Flp pilus assembly protein CpaB [Oceanococcaceae bacterium]